MKHRIVHALQKYVLNPPIKLVFAMGLAAPGYALLETIGRKSGKPRRTPVGNGRIGRQFWIVAEHGMKAGYILNIKRNPRVRLKLRDGVRARWHTGTAHLKEFNLHTIVRLPNGVFAPYTGIPTNLLFFDRTGPTKQIWYYENQKRENGNYSKSKPMQFEEFADCLSWWKHREENERAWKVAASDVLANNCNLDRRNPSSQADLVHTPPDQLLEAIIGKETRLLEIITEVRDILKKYS